MMGLFGFLLGLNATVCVGLLWQLRQLHNTLDFDRALTRNKMRHIYEELSAISMMVNSKNTSANIAEARRKRGGF